MCKINTFQTQLVDTTLDVTVRQVKSVKCANGVNAQFWTQMDLACLNIAA